MQVSFKNLFHKSDVIEYIDVTDVKAMQLDSGINILLWLCKACEKQIKVK